MRAYSLRNFPAAALRLAAEAMGHPSVSLSSAAVMEPSASPDSRPENENGQEVANGWMRQWKGKWEQVSC